MDRKKIARIFVDQTVCIGAAPCVAIANKTFALNENSRAEVINPHGDSDELIWQAAESCPVQAIKLFDENRKQIYP